MRHFGAALRPFGFTLVELVVVMILLGIVGGFAAQRFTDRGGFDSRAYSDQVKSVLRYAQKTAIAQRRIITVSLASGRIAACYGAFPCPPASLVQAPGGANSSSSNTRAACQIANVFRPRWLCEGAPAALAVAPIADFTFDATGAPSFAATQQIVITGDGVATTITIEGATGYVY
jgi:MSHA pilin protein MshC